MLWKLYKVIAFCLARLGHKIGVIWFKHSFLPFTKISWLPVMRIIRGGLEYPHLFGVRFAGYRKLIKKLEV